MSILVIVENAKSPFNAISAMPGHSNLKTTEI